MLFCYSGKKKFWFKFIVVEYNISLFNKFFFLFLLICCRCCTVHSLYNNVQWMFFLHQIADFIFIIYVDFSFFTAEGRFCPHIFCYFLTPKFYILNYNLLLYWVFCLLCLLFIFNQFFILNFLSVFPLFFLCLFCLFCYIF